MEGAGLYFDSSIGEIRQKAEFDKTRKRKDNKPLNPITGRIIVLIVIWVAINAYLAYCAYVQSKKLNRRTWIWVFNCLIGGIPSFIVLSLSPSLKYNRELDIREEPDLLGQVMFFSNISVLLIIYIIISTYFMIMSNPEVLIDFVGNKY